VTTISKIALLVFLAVGVLASAEGVRPGRSDGPFPRATLLPTREGFQALTPTEAARFRDERLNYYENKSPKDDPNWNGRAIMGAGGAGDQYDQCRANCARQTPQSAACNAACDQQFLRSASSNGPGASAAAPGGDRQPASFPTPSEHVYFPDGTR
jgi:hypothetical protein